MAYRVIQLHLIFIFSLLNNSFGTKDEIRQNNFFFKESDFLSNIVSIKFPYHIPNIFIRLCQFFFLYKNLLIPILYLSYLQRLDKCTYSANILGSFCQEFTLFHYMRSSCFREWLNCIVYIV